MENHTGIGVIEIFKGRDIQIIVDVTKDLSGLITMKLINKNQSEKKILLMHMDTQADARYVTNPSTIGLIIAWKVAHLRHQLRTKQKILHCLQKVYKAVIWKIF